MKAPKGTRRFILTFLFFLSIAFAFYQPFSNMLNDWAREDCLAGDMAACNWVDQLN